MKRVEHFGLQASEEEKQNYRVTELEVRVRELEHIVHALLRDRTHQDFADAWLSTTGGEPYTFTPNVMTIRDRGKRIAADLDRWPEAQKWSPPAWAETAD